MERYNVRGELEASFGLCEGRHKYPVEECIFPETIPVFAFARQELDAREIIAPLMKKGLKRLVIYPSGCTPALMQSKMTIKNKLYQPAIILCGKGENYA